MRNGYQTAIAGKWHLGHGGVSDPHGFDYWNVFPVQGAHINPEMIEMGEGKKFDGYSADIVTDSSLRVATEQRGRSTVLSHDDL